MDQARRLRSGLELLLELRAVRAHGGDIPDLDRLQRVQAVAQETGGMATLVAEIMASRTGLPVIDDRPVVLGGRQFVGWSPDGTPRGHDISHPRVGWDLAAARVAVPLVVARPGRATMGVTALEQLAGDVRTQRAFGPEEGRAVARWLGHRAPEIAAQHGVGPCGSVATTTRARPGQVATAAVRLVLGDGLTHARIGAAGRWSGSTLVITHWETVRIVSTAVRRLIGSMIQPAGRDAARVRELAEPIGISHALIRDLLPAVDDALEPILPYVPDLETHTDRDPDGIPSVADHLGLIYGMATLVGVGRLMTATGDSPTP